MLFVLFNVIRKYNFTNSTAFGYIGLETNEDKYWNQEKKSRNVFIRQRIFQECQRRPILLYTFVITPVKGKYSRTSMTRAPGNHVKMFETGVVRANECFS